LKPLKNNLHNNNRKVRNAKYPLFDLAIVMTQFILISLHFVKVKYLNQKIFEEENILPKLISNSLIIFGIILIIFSFNALGKSLSPLPSVKKDSKLKTTGIYKFMRHPMYFSVISISIGFFLRSLTIYNFFLTILLFLVILLKINIEEKYLTKSFPKYESYRRKVKI